MSFPTIFSITEDEIDLNVLLAQITLTSTGAAAIFTGMVRGETHRGEAHETDYLEYEAYIPMAEAKMKQVADEIRERWPVIEGIAIVQRIGKLYPKRPLSSSPVLLLIAIPEFSKQRAMALIA